MAGLSQLSRSNQDTPDEHNRAAEWCRCDLHVHSGYDRKNFTDQPITGDARAFQQAPERDIHKLAVQFLNACDSAANGEGLDIVAITDHNTVDGFKRLQPHIDEIRQARLRAGRKTPVVLPGVEISIGGERPIHLLIIFSADTDVDEIDATIRHIFGANSRFNQDQTQPLSAGIAIGEFFRRIYEYAKPDNGQRNLQFLVIPAHLTNSRGIERETQTNDRHGLSNELAGYLRQTALTNKHWHGFQTSRPFTDLPQDLQDLLALWMSVKENKAWSKMTKKEKLAIRNREHWPLIEASDPKTSAEIGRQFTWMKMGTHDLEGIRLALLDPASRLRRMQLGQPNLDFSRIDSIVIKNTDLYQQIKIPFSPNLTTIIGGRGAGKSTIIEYLRYSLDRAKSADFSDSSEAGSIKRYVDSILSRKRSRDYGLNEGTLLEDYLIEVEVTVSKRVYRITRSSVGIQTFSLDENGDAKVTDSLDVRTLIRPKIISQKQIAHIAENPAALRTELDALLDTSELQSIRDGIHRDREKLIDLQRERTSLENDRLKLPELYTELRTVSDQISIVEDAGNRKVLAAFRDVRQKSKWLKAVRDELVSLAIQFDNLSQQTETEPTNSQHLVPVLTTNESKKSDPNDWIQSVIDRIHRTRGEAAQGLKHYADTLRSLAETLQREQSETWDPYCKSVYEDYKQVEGELPKQGTSPAFYEQLIQRRVGIQRQIDNLSARVERLTGTVRELQHVRGHLIGLYRQWTELRKSRALTLESMDADVRLKIRQFGDRDQFESQWVQWFGGSGVRERHWHAVCDYIFEFPNEIPDRIAQVVTAFRTDIQLTCTNDGAITQSESALASLVKAELDGHFFRALLKGDQIRLDDIERFLPDDLIAGRVRSTEGSFKAIETSSIGQRSTAILSLLLSAGSDPIILDQPEDDLDNQYVYNVVVDLLRRKKFSRQIIIATHNANIPVNGDAELIVALGVQNQGGRVLCQGSIDEDSVKRWVSLIMEGSVEAFRRRRDRYGF